MKLLSSEFEYREWMVKDYLHLDEEYPSAFEPDELERELLSQMPSQFPCIAYTMKGPSPHELEMVQYFYRHQVEEWAKLLGIVN